MRGIRIAALVLGAVCASGACAAAPKHGLTPADRCGRLSVQLDRALKARPADKDAVLAEALRKRGDRLCFQKKWAQGLRSYASGLKLLGAKPVGID